MKKTSRFISVVAVLLISAFPIQSIAQIEVFDSPVDIDDMVQAYLIGQGVLPSNEVYYGEPEQLGVFEEPTDYIGIAGGIVLSTGNKMNLDMTETYPDLSFGTNTPDSNLLAVANLVPDLIGQNFTVSSVNDLAFLEFDFVALGDSLAFKYLFVSDEYLTFVNTSYNDVFAFFLSGPGINGEYGAPAAFPNGSINIATVPDSDPPLPITVSSVNDMLNSDYYVDPFDNDIIDINGFTTVFTAFQTGLVYGETYHIKIAIADGSDIVLDSAVLLESGSFMCFVTDIPDGVADESVDLTTAHLKVFPNPSSGTFNYQWTHHNGVELKLVDLMGKKLSTIRLVPGSGKFTVPATIGDGVYLLQSADLSLNYKIMIEHGMN